jgi:ABC-2 type transport system permease protein
VTTSTARPGGPSLLSELHKLPAFARRDLLLKLSYRTAFLTDAVSLVMQSLIFYFVGKLVDPSKIPLENGGRNPYVAYVAVGIALAAFMALALSRVTTVIEREHLIGTLESLLVTPTGYATLQLGSVSFDLLYVPIRTALFLTLVSLLYGVTISLAGLPAALLTLLVFIPFVWGLGIICAAVVLTFRRGAGLVAFFATLLSFGSGAYFPLALFPDWIETVVRWNPVAVAMRDLRAALLDGASIIDVAPGLLIVAVSAVVTLSVGVLAFRAAVARERRNGTIGLY